MNLDGFHTGTLFYIAGDDIASGTTVWTKGIYSGQEMPEHLGRLADYERVIFLGEYWDDYVYVLTSLGPGWVWKGKLRKL